MDHLAEALPVSKESVLDINYAGIEVALVCIENN